MLKFVHDEVWAMDAEWVPDPDTGRRVYGLDPALDDHAVLERMWQEGGATEEDPQPYLKTALCRVVSVSAVIRRRGRGGGVRLQLYSLPAPSGPALSEAELLQRLLTGMGRSKPQLVGFNIRGSDLPIILQRALVHGLSAPEFCARPAKPWEGVDYFARSSDWVVDLKDLWGGYGKATPSLNELAAAARIPGKIEVSGEGVADLWAAGEIGRIVEYNEFDALTTYLVWLRTVHLAGFLDDEQYREEEGQLRDLLAELAQGDRPHLTCYLERWDEFRKSPGDITAPAPASQPPSETSP